MAAVPNACSISAPQEKYAEVGRMATYSVNILEAIDKEASDEGGIRTPSQVAFSAKTAHVTAAHKIILNVEAAPDDRMFPVLNDDASRLDAA